LAGAKAVSSIGTPNRACSISTVVSPSASEIVLRKGDALAVDRPVVGKLDGLAFRFPLEEEARDR
jgi:hypothetical protein